MPIANTICRVNRSGDPADRWMNGYSVVLAAVAMTMKRSMLRSPSAKYAASTVEKTATTAVSALLTRVSTARLIANGIERLPMWMALAADESRNGTRSFGAGPPGRRPDG